MPRPSGADWVGKRVVQQDRKFALRDGKQAVIWSGRQIHVYRVERVDGARLRLRAEGKDGSPSGWAAADQVVPVDQAIPFFSDRIRANPQEAFAHMMRAIALRDDDNLPNAFDIPNPARDPLDDLNDAVHLDPRDAAAHGTGKLLAGAGPAR